MIIIDQRNSLDSPCEAKSLKGALASLLYNAVNDRRSFTLREARRAESKGEEPFEILQPAIFFRLARLAV